MILVASSLASRRESTTKEADMATIFHVEDDKQHLFGEQSKEDILFVMQIPVALTTLAVLFFLA